MSRLSLFARAGRVLRAYREIIHSQEREILLYQHAILHHQRALLNMAVAFRVSLETPEVDIRDDLEEMIRDLELSIAQTEEHVV